MYRNHKSLKNVLGYNDLKKYFMKNIKSYFSILLAALMLASCGTKEDSSIDKEKTLERIPKEGSKIKYGSTLKVALDEKYVTLFPAAIEDAISSKIASQIYDGLVKFDSKELTILPAIAKDWTVSETQLEYTFNLRNDVYFHNDACFKDGKGRKVTAEDVKYSFEILNNKEYSQNTQMFQDKVVGASSFVKGESKNIEGIVVVNDTTIMLRLENPQPSFIYTLAMANTAIIAKEAVEKYGQEMTVGAGAFKYVQSEGDDVYLVFNENYYGKDAEGNSLPYLDSVKFAYVPTKLVELEMFRTKDVDVLHGLPTTKIAEVVADNIANFKNKPPKTILVREPEMVSQYYEFNLQVPPFDNVKVRQALNYAVNREKLINNVLNGQGTIGNKGITPRIRPFKDYDFESIKGYEYNPELAKKLLAEAGYPNGKGFPHVRLEINLGGNTHKLVASEIQNQWTNTLGINVEVEQVSFADKVEHSKYGKSEIFRSAWVADYPSPESFLSLFYGENVPETLDEPSNLNTMRFKNIAFDTLYIKGIKTADQTERYGYFAQAENIMMEESPVIILWYQENYTLYHSEVRNFHYNAMEYFDFSEVYKKEVTEEEIKEQEEKIESGQPATGF